MITQNSKPIAFFSRKLTSAQTRYSVTKIELLAIVETLKEFKVGGPCQFFWGDFFLAGGYVNNLTVMSKAIAMLVI